MEENWSRKEFSGEDAAQFGRMYYEVTSPSAWNFGLSEADLRKAQFEVTEHPADGSYPWNPENAPVSIKTEAVTLPYWKACGGNVGPVAYYDEVGSGSGEKVLTGRLCFSSYQAWSGVG